MQEKIANLRENITDIAKAVGAENYEIITKSLEAMTETLAEISKKAENLETEKAEAVKKYAEMHTYAENLPALMKELVDAMKIQSDNIAVLQKSFDNLAVGTSKQDKTEEVTKAQNPLEILNKKLGF